MKSDGGGHGHLHALQGPQLFVTLSCTGPDNDLLLPWPAPGRQRRHGMPHMQAIQPLDSECQCVPQGRRRDSPHHRLASRLEELGLFLDPPVGKLEFRTSLLPQR